MCSPRVVGMAKPSSRDRFPRWKSMWWTCSHSWQEVALGSTAGTPGDDEVNVGNMGKKVKSDEVDILMQFQPEDQGRAAENESKRCMIIRADGETKMGNQMTTVPESSNRGRHVTGDLNSAAVSPI
ncbi:hypothetical protein XENOCAPTIV_018097 [Xenoophorus captivus]|uniref:Uncharacterized protein n=1 Tax=Xenoophorus captivus TaxID=1517983 RepID=A0ABV0R2A4_9TELE